MKKFYFLLLALIVGATAAVVWAADEEPELTFSGSGTEADPYLIQSAADLQALAEACNGPDATARGHYAGKYFKQTADIDMSSATDFIGIGTTPYGTRPSTSWYFAGVYDGDGHTIKNLTIDAVAYKDDGSVNTSTSSADGSRNYVGLFGYLYRGSEVKNVVLDASCSIQGIGNLGSIAGYANYNAKITNCKSSAKVQGFGSNVGGIVGFANGSSRTTNVELTGNVFSGTVANTSTYTGGIVGESKYVKISNCANEGDVSAIDNELYTGSGRHNYVGGIAGDTYSQGSIENCLNSGTVTGAQYVAGIAGNVSGSNSTVNACVNHGNLITNETQYVGAIAGNLAGKASNCYYDAQINGSYAVKGSSDFAGVSGKLTRQLTAGNTLTGLSSGYWTLGAGKYPVLKDAKGDKADDAATTFFTLPDDETADNFKTSATLASGVTATLEQGTSFTVADGKIVSADVSSVVEDVATLTKGNFSKKVALKKIPKLWQGAGTEADPYLIQTKADLMSLATMVNEQSYHYDGEFFKQTADIDMESDSAFHGVGSVFTGKSSPENTFYFAGTYDGGGFTVKNLNIMGMKLDDEGVVASYNDNNGSTNNVGLFGAVVGGTIKNVTVSGHIEGFENVGGIAGLANKATIENCVNLASIDGYSSNVGGIVGESGNSATTITRVRNKGDVRGNSCNVGGIVGSNSGSVSLAQNDGTVSGVNLAPLSSTSDNDNNQYDVGGIIGYNTGSSAKGENLLNTGRVSASKFQAGGIVGQAYNGGISASLNLGNVTTPDVATTGAIAGKGEDNFASDYYDTQLSGLGGVGNTNVSGTNATSTTALTAGTALEGLADSVWTFKAGFYPVLTVFNDAYSQAAAATYITLPEGEKANNFKTTGVISTAQSGITATLATGTVFQIADGKLTAKATNEIATDVLTLTNGSYSLDINLQKLPKLFDGTGSASDPYLIKTADDFLAAANQLKSANFNYDGEYFQVVNDLDFTDKTFVPMGSEDVPFAGVFDGNGKTFNNVTYAGTDKTDGTAIGLFGSTSKKATIKNVKLDNSAISGVKNVGGIVGINQGAITGCEIGENVVLRDTVAGNSSDVNGNNLGGIAGQTKDGTTISNCVNRGTLYGYQYTGGIVGDARFADVTLEGNTNYGAISATTTLYGQYSSRGGAPTWHIESKDAYVGGIAGAAVGKVSNCSNHGDIYTMTSYAGGIAGSIVSTSAVDSSYVSDCSNYAKVQADYQYAGGLFGNLSKAQVNRVHNEGEVTLRYYQYAGGIAGNVTANSVIANASNEGNVTFNGEHFVATDSTRGTTRTSVLGYVGGLIGQASANTKVLSSWNAGNVVSHGTGTGGISGAGNALVIDRCFNVGNVSIPDSTLTSVAGLVAGGRTTFTNSYNAGDITGYRGVGGINGMSLTGGSKDKGANATNVYSVGQIKYNGYADETHNEETEAGNRGNIFGVVPANSNYPAEAVNAFALKDHVAGNGESDAFYKVNLVTADELFAADSLGSAFVLNDYTFPMIAGLDTVPAARVFAAYFSLNEGETADSVATAFPLSAIQGITWTATGALTIKDGQAVPNGTGVATLTVSAGKYSKTYTFNVVQGGLRGDYNGDGVVNTDDLTELVNAILGGSTEAKYDLDGDASITAGDVTEMVNLIMSK